MKRQRLLRQKERKGSAQADHRSRPNMTFAVRKATRERWAAMAAETQGIVLGDGQYVEERRVSLVTPALAQPDRQGSDMGEEQIAATLRVVHNISVHIELSRQATTFYPHYSDLLAHWVQRRPTTNNTKTAIEFTRTSTLTAARRLAYASPALHTHNSSSVLQTALGVLAFASAKRPGGGFLHGGDEQEETMARLSSLVASLGAPAAQQFYKEHRKYRVEDGSGLHDHSMVYSPGVVVFRQDSDDTLAIIGEEPSTVTVDVPLAADSIGGDFIPPYTINVVSSVPVNAAAVRAKHLIPPSEEQFFEDGIRSAMKERMARVLRLFEEHGNRVIVLGAFGCASSQNKVEMVASVWAELLVCGDSEGQGGGKREARFKDVFEKVVFAVPGKLFESFRKAFEMRIFEEQVEEAAMDNE